MDLACPPAGIYSSAIACGMVSRRYWGLNNNFMCSFWYGRATSSSLEVVVEGKEEDGSQNGEYGLVGCGIALAPNSLFFTACPPPKIACSRRCSIVSPMPLSVGSLAADPL